MIKLYYVPMTRAGRVRWMLEEMGLPYEVARLDVAAKQNRTPEYLAIHPLGHVPAIEIDGAPMFESAAIVMHLADLHPDKRLAPPPGTALRGPYYQWMAFAMTELEPAVAMVSYHTAMRPVERRIAAVADEGREKFAACSAVLAAHLATRKYMLGDEFTATDVVIGGVLGWSKATGILTDGRLLEYLKSLTGRDAFRRARAD
jgi:glutathione S-transferase